MKKILFVILSGLILFFNSACSEKIAEFDKAYETDIQKYNEENEISLDIVVVPEDNSEDKTDIIPDKQQDNDNEENEILKDIIIEPKDEIDIIKVTIYNQFMEKIDEFDKKYEYHEYEKKNEDYEDLWIQIKEKFDYKYIGEFKNGFSFVGGQKITGLWASQEWNDNIFYLYAVSRGFEENYLKIFEEDYKFINTDGNVIFDNLEADLSWYSTFGSQTEPGDDNTWITIIPSYFTEYGLAVVKRDGKFGLIDTSGEILLDFIFKEITIVDKSNVTACVDSNE